MIGKNPFKDNSWAVNYMAVEYQKEYNIMRKNGIVITPDIAIDFLRNSIGDPNVKN